MEELLNLTVLGLLEIRQILLHMLFQININLQKVLHMKKRVHTKPQEAFLKIDKKSRDYKHLLFLS